MFQENNPFVVRKNGPHRTSCVWSRNETTEGPDTCPCSVEHLEAVRWIDNYLSPDFKNTRFGLHRVKCSILQAPLTENTTLGRLHICTCTIDLVQALTNKFMQETPASKTDLDRVLEQVLRLNNKLEGTRIVSNDERSAATTFSRDPKPLTKVTQSNADRMKMRVYFEPNCNNLYFLRRLPENMTKSENIFLTKNGLHNSGLFLTSRSPVNAELHQLMSAMKKFFPRGRQTGRDRFHVGDDIKDDLSYLLSTVNRAIDSIQY